MLLVFDVAVISPPDNTRCAHKYDAQNDCYPCANVAYHMDITFDDEGKNRGKNNGKPDSKQ